MLLFALKLQVWTDLTLEMYQNFSLMDMPGVLQSAVCLQRGQAAILDPSSEPEGEQRSVNEISFHLRQLAAGVVRLIKVLFSCHALTSPHWNQ